MASESDILEEYQPFDVNLGQDFWKGIGKSGKPWTEEKKVLYSLFACFG